MSMDNIISSYTRSNALEDGVLVDLSKLASEAGVKIPLAVTCTVWEKYIATDPELEKIGQSVEGRAWDIVWVFSRNAKNSNSDFIFFSVLVRHGPKEKDIDEVDLKAVIGPGDQGEPVITIMLPHET